jgi:2-(1,2-epoxy-1,2-dihydrophenyl)acetyl-CoA isomerase
MTVTMLRETHDALVEAASDPSVRVVLLTGAGDQSFCPGADLNWATSGARGDEGGRPIHYRVGQILHDMPAISVAAINGACAGAGMGWALGCDIRVAVRHAMFNTAFINVAVAGDMGIPWSLPRLIGASKARELSFLAEKFTADDAKELGLVAKVWDQEQFRAETDALLKRLLGWSPTALRAMKAHYNRAETMPYQAYVDYETEDHARITASADTREAFRAFLEKRPPVFTGK